MRHKEIEKKRKELTEILAQENAEKRWERLQKLAREVGASVTRMGKTPIHQNIDGRICYTTSNEITETEIVHNIQFALQTETMIEVCRTSAKNFWVALVATVIALLAMFAAWAAVVVKVKGFEP
jgi:hypothetical protein